MKHGELLAIGGAYVDINVPNFPIGENGLQLETETVGQGYELVPGGSAVNFARICSALGMPTTFVGKVGKDEMGIILSDMLEQAEVEPLLVISEDVSTNISFNMVNDRGQTIMAVAGDANQSLTADELIIRAQSRLEECHYLFIGGGFKLKSLLPTLEKLILHAGTSNTSVVLDHGRLNNKVTAEERLLMKSLAKLSDYYLPSKDEFIELWEVASIEEGLNLLEHEVKGMIVVKDGENGVVSIVNGEIVRVPTITVKPIHTVGAGDSFDAGFITALSKGNEFIDSMRFGCITAALKISQRSLPSYIDVANYIADHS
ncbi:MAG TPA: carbohydrate kinase family protein [Candidatus Saccharimonadales bacterium]